MMEFIIDNLYLFVVMAAVLTVLIVTTYRFFKLPTNEQIAAVREWLLMAVTDAEAQLGSGTGELKLRSVYDLFVVRFPWLAKVLSFSQFSELVDDALAEMEELLAENEKIRGYVKGGVEE